MNGKRFCNSVPCVLINPLFKGCLVKIVGFFCPSVVVVVLLLNIDTPLSGCLLIEEQPDKNNSKKIMLVQLSIEYFMISIIVCMP